MGHVAFGVELTLESNISRRRATRGDRRWSESFAALPSSTTGATFAREGMDPWRSKNAKGVVFLVRTLLANLEEVSMVPLVSG